MGEIEYDSNSYGGRRNKTIMNKYKVDVIRIDSGSIEVEARDAIEAAKQATGLLEEDIDHIMATWDFTEIETGDIQEIKQ